MHKKVIFLCFLATIVLFSGTIVAQEDTFFIKSEAFEPRQRPGVEFNHLLHYESLECTDCHHDYVNEENVWDMYSGKNYCSDCHTVDGNEHVMGLMQAFHVQCIGCHQEYHSRGLHTGYIMCGECHARR
ncbi:cytochrome c3 family protein [Desulfonatronum parangueonense]